MSPPNPYLVKFWFTFHHHCRVFYKLILSFWVFAIKHAHSSQNKKFVSLCNISRKAGWMKLIFFLHININVFYKVIASLRVCVARHTQSPQNNRFAISLQYLMENVKDEVDFLSADNFKDFFR